MEFKRSSAAAVSGSPPLHVSKLHLTDHLRTLLPVRNVLEHLQEEHGKGNRYPKFILEIRDGRGEAIAVEVVESQTAILPTATYSVHGRPSREVGHLGHLNLVSADEVSGDFVLLTVNPVDGEVRGVVKKLEEDWVIVNGENEMFSSGRERNLDLFETADDDIVENVPREAVEKLHVIEEGLHTLHPRRQLQAFHSNYLYQVDLFLDIDYEFVLNNGGTLCNVISYVNSLVSAANAVLEREVMAHLNVVSLRQTDFYDDVDSTTDALGKMKKEFGGPEWHENGVDLHYALLGKMLRGGLGERAGIAFIENSLCDPTRGFGLVSGLKGGFSRLDERLGSDLKRFMYAIGHSFGSGPVSGELESLLFTYGGSWSHRSKMNSIDSWLDNPNLDSRENPRRVPYNMFVSANDQSDKCLDVSSRSYTEEDSIIGECLSGMSFKRSDGNDLSFESSKHYLSDAMVGSQGPTFSPSYIPTYLPTLVPTASPTRSKSSKQTKGADDSKGGKNDDKNSGSSKTAKVMASTRMGGGSYGVEVAPSKFSFSSAVAASPTYSPSYVPTYVPTLVPTASPTRSKSVKQTKGADDSKGGKNGDEGNGSSKTAKVMTSTRIIGRKHGVEVAPSKLSFSSAVAASPTYSPSYVPTYVPTLVPTASPTRSKSSKQTQGADDSKGGKNGEENRESSKTAKEISSDRDVTKNDDKEISASKLLFAFRSFGSGTEVASVKHSMRSGGIPSMMTSIVNAPKRKTEGGSGKTGKDPKEHKQPSESKSAKKRPRNMTTIYMYSTLEWNFNCSDVNTATLVNVAAVVEKSIFQGIAPQITPLELVSVFVWSICNHAFLTNTPRTGHGTRLLEEVPLTKIEFIAQVTTQDYCDNCGQQLFTATSSALQSIVKSENLTSSIHINSNGTILAIINPNSTNSTFTLSTSRPTKSPSSSPRTTNPPTQKPRKTRTRKPTPLPTSPPARKPTQTPSSSSPTKLVITNNTTTTQPTNAATKATKYPSTSPSKSPSKSSNNSTTSPITKPSLSTSLSSSPSKSPISFRTDSPSKAPSNPPSTSPTRGSSISQSSLPSMSPTKSPSNAPSKPSAFPSEGPSMSPMGGPIKAPSNSPSTSPTRGPSISPLSLPSISPTKSPSKAPSTPSASPSAGPSLSPMMRPSKAPSTSPSTSPTQGPSISPSLLPSISPMKNPTKAPSNPTASPSAGPTLSPMGKPSKAPSTSPSTSPTQGPRISPSSLPSISLTESPSKAPLNPSASPSAGPSLSPMRRPSKAPSTSPTTSPTQGPSISPSSLPSISPTKSPSEAPSQAPSRPPTKNPSTAPSAGPILFPTKSPSKAPSGSPSITPT